LSRYPDREPESSGHGGGAVDLVLRARPRDLGGFAVRRALPSAQRRLVGPFIFWDHMGPASFEPGHGIDVRPHPHIGLATVTYLFDGEIVHKDTLGSDIAIRPGAVNWMTAGRGIAHSERTSPEARMHGARAHGIQSWVALPLEHEETEPSFTHHPAETIPEGSQDGVRLRVIAGRAYGLTSPATVLSPMFYVEAVLPAGARLVLPDEYEERAVYVVEGAVECDGSSLVEGDLLVARPRQGAEVALHAAQPSRVMLFGGAPLEGPRHIWWNFVSSSERRIAQAKEDWSHGRFPKIPGDEAEFIPLPSDAH
jgi:redox-sensitive bicupin YhaK (pirin superfamily)